MRSNKKLVLHVGLPKTGTSALQEWLAENRDFLDKHSICAPVDNNVYGPKFNNIVQSLRSCDYTVFAKFLRDSASETVFVCHEGLSNHFFDYSDPSLSQFRELTNSYDTTVILVTRAKTKWTKSYFKQCIINPQNGSSGLWGTALQYEDFCQHPRVQSLLDHKALAQQLSSGFGAQTTVQLSYDHDDWFQKILGILGLDRVLFPPLKIINDAVPEWSTLLVHHVNRMGISQELRDRWIAALEIYLNTGNVVFARTLMRYDRSEFFGENSQISTDIIEECAVGHDQVVAKELMGFKDFVAEQSLLANDLKLT